MADEPTLTTEAAPAAAEVTPPAGEPADKPSGGESETISLDEAKKLRSEARQLRERTKQAEAKIAEYEESSKSEAQKLTDKLVKAETDAKDHKATADKLALQLAVLKQASDPKLAARDPQKLLKLVDADALEIDGENVIGLDAELKRIKSEWPELFIPVGGSGDGGAGTRVPQPTDMNALIRKAAGRG